MRPDRELLKGTTETVVLATLAEEPGHGYAIAQRLRARSAEIFALGEGTLYPLLYKLEGRGWLKSRWEPGEGRRRRRVYSITPKGRKALTARTEQWNELVNGMRRVLKSGAIHA